MDVRKANRRVRTRGFPKRDCVRCFYDVLGATLPQVKFSQRHDNPLFILSHSSAKDVPPSGDEEHAHEIKALTD